MGFEESGPEAAVVFGNTFANQSLPKFEELIQEIDKSINVNHRNLNSKKESYLPTMTKERNLVPFENSDNGVNSKGSDMVMLDVDLHYPVPYSNSHNPTIKEIKFNMGCKVGNVEAIGTGRKKGKPKLAIANMKRPKNVNKLGSTIKPMILDSENIGEVEVGLKRKLKLSSGEMEELEQNKKFKLVDGSRTFDSFENVSLVLAEVARQPRRVQ